MGYKFNPLIFSGLDLAGGESVTTWKSPVQSVTDLPQTDADGTVRLVLDDNRVYAFDADTSKWYDITVTIESFGTLASDDGITLTDEDETIGSVTVVRRSLTITPADATHPGAVSTGTQSFSGDKTFNNNVSVTSDLTVGGDSHINGSQTVDLNSTIVGDETIQGSLQVDTDSTVTGNSSVGGNLIVTGSGSTGTTMSVGTDLTVEANSLIKGDEHILGGLEVDGNTVIQGDLTVNGTTTTVNSTNLEITDKNILVNKDGDDTTAEGAGITVQRSTVNGSLVYDKDVASFWKIGNEGSEIEIVNVSSTQTLTNKTFDADSNTLSNISDSNIKVGAGINAEKLADGSVSNTELQYIGTLTSNAQDQLDAKINLSEKGVADGVATLDANGLVPESQLPPVSKIDTFIVASEAEMVALTAQTGDHAIRTDLNTTFILKGSDPAVTSDWQEIISRVNQVNGLTGDVTLTTTEITEGTNLYYTEARFDSSFGGKTTTDLAEGTNLYFTDSRAQTASVVDSPVWTETVQAASARAVKEYTDSQELKSLDESQTDTVLIDLVSAYSMNSGAKVIVTVKIDADTDLFEYHELNCVKNSTGYHFSIFQVGDDTGVDFEISDAGELTYSSGTYTGFVSGECKVKVIPLI